MSIATELAKLVKVFREWPHEKREVVEFIMSDDDPLNPGVSANKTPEEVMSLISSGKAYDAFFEAPNGLRGILSVSGYNLNNKTISFNLFQNEIETVGQSTMAVMMCFTISSEYSEENGTWSDWSFRNDVKIIN